MGLRRQRAMARNEARVRQLNERVQAAVEEFDSTAEPLDVMCECASDDCVEMLALSPEQYHRVRSNSAWFAVAPDHLAQEGERQVEDNGTWWLVEKLGVGAEIAAATDPT
jgi:hypothetical protein